MAKAIINGVEINKFVVDGGGGGELATDWSKIGYDTIPKTIQTSYTNAKEIYDNWDENLKNLNYQFAYKNVIIFPKLTVKQATECSYTFSYTKALEIDLSNWNISNVTRMDYMFNNCTSLTSITFGDSFDTSNVTTMYGVFYDCSSLTSLDLSNFNTSNVTNMSNMFQRCTSLTSITFGDSFNTSNVTNMNSMFYDCSSLTSLDLSNFNTSNVTNMSQIFSTNSLISVVGKIDISKITGTINQYYFGGYSTRKNLLKITFGNLGYNADNTSYNYSYTQNWGVNSDDILDAKQSLIDSLITYSFDRASAGYSTCTITLHANSKATLTEDEIAQITAKGFTIA